MTGQALSRLSWTSASHPRLRPCVNADRRALSGTKVRTLGTRVRDLRLFRPLLLTSVPGPGVTVVRPDGYIGFRGPRRPASSPPGSPASVRSAYVAEDGAGHLVDGRGDERGQAGALGQVGRLDRVHDEPTGHTVQRERQPDRVI